MKKVISLGVSKEAALYFDHVFPDDLVPFGIAKIERLGGAVDASIPLHDEDTFTTIANSLMPHRADAADLLRVYNRLSAAELLIQFQIAGVDINTDALHKLLEGLCDRLPSLGLKLDRTAGPSHDMSRRLASERAKIVAALGFFRAPSWFNEDIWTPRTRSNAPDTTDNFILSLRGLEVIDVRGLSWEAVTEFRKDEQSRQALRKLRLFFRENFCGEEPDSISDRLLSLEEEYRKAARLWGFETTHNTLTVAFAQSSTLVTSVGGLAAAMAGVPLGIAAAAAATIPVGKFALEFSKAAIDASKAKAHNPVKFISHLRSLDQKRMK